MTDEEGNAISGSAESADSSAQSDSSADSAAQSGSAADSTTADSARTALPHLVPNDFTSFKLEGSTDGGFEWTALWNSSDTANALAELSGADIAVAEGIWEFRLFGYKGGAKYIGYNAGGRTEIVAGKTNALSFTLVLYHLGADSTNSTGTVQVTMTFPASGVSRVTAEVRSLDGTVVFAEEAATVSGSGTTKRATYEKAGLLAGTYAVNFYFYATDASTGANILIGICCEYAGIASGVTSISNGIKIESLDQTYPITYNWNSGGLASGATAQGTYSRHSSVTLPVAAKLTRTGYTFAGWYDNAALTGTAITEIPEDSTGAKSFWAKWTANTYTITYDDGVSDATISVPAAATCKCDENFTVSFAGVGTRTGYSFAGWTDGTATYTSGSTASFVMGAGDVTLTAVWKAVEYTITYNLGGGAWASGYTAVSSYTVESGAITLPTASNATRATYTFGGWYADSSFSADAVTLIAGGSTGNKIFYAKWNLVTYTVTFNSNTGSAVESQTVTIGDTATEPTAPTKDGWIFDGWMTSLADTKVYDSTKYDFGTAVTGDITLYARWRRQMYIMCVLKSATRNAAAVNVFYGGTYAALYTAGAIPTFTGDWATFDAWYTEMYGEGTKITADMTVDDSITFTATPDGQYYIFDNWNLAYSEGEVGDIVLQTGKFVTAENYAAGTIDYNQFNGGTWANGTCSSTAVAVIFYDGKSQTTLGTKKLGVGLKQGNYNWAKSGTTGHSKNFEEILCKGWYGISSDGIPYIISSNDSITGDFDGSDNWAAICAADPDGTADAATNYPAFNWANTYGTENAIPGDCENGWYIPSIVELHLMYCNLTAVNAALTVAGGTTLNTGRSTYYYSSSQDIANKTVHRITFSNGDYTPGNKTDVKPYCVIREF